MLKRAKPPAPGSGKLVPGNGKLAPGSGKLAPGSGKLAPGGERPIGEIFGDLVDEGKAYARAEFNVAKAIASAKASGLKAPLILLAVAAVVGMAALNALAVAIFILLALLMKPVLAAILAFLLIAGTAGLLAWLGIRKMKTL